MQIQNMMLFNKLRLRINGSFCTMTSGICNIMRENPYPRNFLVIQPMTSSCLDVEGQQS